VASLPLISSRALAPSEMELALAAVIVPSLAKAGAAGNALDVGLVRLLVVADHGLALARGLHGHRVRSRRREPSSMAALARRRDSMAKASISFAGQPSRSAVSWAKLPMGRPS
jgi:hypothetical protein